MEAIITAFFTAVQSAVSNLPAAINGMFSHLLWVDPAATTKQLTDISQFCFVVLGLGLVLGIGKFCMSLIRRKI